MVNKNEFSLAFEGLDGPDANVAVEGLKDEILGLGAAGLEVRVHKERRDTQDLGTTLVLVLGSPVAISVARGIAAWIRRRAEMTTLVIRDKNGNELIRYNGDSKHLDKLANVLHGK